MVALQNLLQAIFFGQPTKRKKKWGWKPKEDAAEVLAVISVEVRQCDWHGAYDSPLLHSGKIRAERNCQQRKSWSRGRGQNLNRFLISGNRAVFQENTGPLPRHTFTSTSMCPPVPVKILHLSLWVFLRPWEINLLDVVDIIDSHNI